MEPVLRAGDEEFSPASAATGGDDYVIIFLCTLGAFYAAVELLNKSVVIAFLRHLWNCSTPVRSGFCFLCFLVGVGWIALMETVVQKLVPVYFITSWGIIASFTFLSLA
ncbi:hypothetical protein RvY_07807 [Ramazzottius varieornatus]|uniref:Uncharacterized protein n=1 Tax=Ramazzottius varieornatus TaxID=947166 RepID=A0A1D1VCW7_RAMVA|nr:hypothetical protein RvY_07807 [Ramazzottius varieornatus]